MNKNKLRIFMAAVVLLTMTMAILWTKEEAPRILNLLNNHTATDKDFFPWWWTISSFSGLAIYFASRLAEWYFNYRIIKARKQYSFFHALIASIKKEPTAFKPEERIEAINSYLVIRLKLKKAQARDWINSVTYQIQLTGAILTILPFCPLMYVMFGGLMGIVK